MPFILFLLIGSLGIAEAAQPQSAVVKVPVADVWSKPLGPDEKPSDDLRETQLLAGEMVLIHETKENWVRIEAVEQPEFSHHEKWEGYPGWTLKKNLGKPPKDKPSLASQTPIPRDILLSAAEAVDTPYLWGGLSIQKGLDCSGLIHLAYRKSNMKIPRDSHEQWMKAKPIKRDGIKPTDLIFSAKAENPKKITHVTMYVGNDQLVEAPQTGMKVRKVSFKDKYGKELSAVESGDTIGDRVIYFGSFLHP